MSVMHLWMQLWMIGVFFEFFEQNKGVWCWIWVMSKLKNVQNRKNSCQNCSVPCGMSIMHFWVQMDMIGVVSGTSEQKKGILGWNWVMSKLKNAQNRADPLQFFFRAMW